MDPDYEQRLFRQVNGQRTPTKSPAVSLLFITFLKYQLRKGIQDYYIWSRNYKLLSYIYNV